MRCIVCIAQNIGPPYVCQYVDLTCYRFRRILDNPNKMQVAEMSKTIICAFRIITSIAFRSKSHLLILRYLNSSK